MELFLKVLEVVTPVIVLGIVGFAWVRMGLEYSVQFVTRLTMTLGVPCLIFTALMNTEIDPAAIRSLTLASIAAYGILTAGIAVLLRLGRLSQRTYLNPLIFGNTGNIGLPLALFAFGPAGFDYAVVVFAVMILWSFTFGVWIVAGGGGLGKVAKEPIVAATALGAVFLWQGWTLPSAISNTLELTGQMAIPLMLITLGVAVARLRPGGVKLAILLSALKLAACAALGWGLGALFGLDPVAQAVLVVQLATPIAVTSYMLAEKYGADAHAVAGLVVVSTTMSILALPLLLALVL
ncbi:AEC family transporter [Poseidonocella sp. HB161398]|uniref:AEC family transporter n=1 Tax=Poseidonocella sp. HB161398 TaxID=2320855 RepID=UPI001107C2BF|nr:AEC family transporter [Poseidonocella sp. HB161398]